MFPRGLALLVAGALFMEILDATVIATAVPAIAESFGTSAVDVNIAISSYLLTLAVLIPVSGWLADRLGVRRVFLAAIVVFTLASVGCALSMSLPMLVGMRVLQGVGGAMMVPVGRLAVLRSTGKAQLVKAIAYLTWPALVAPVLAPAIGGAIATYGSWRWIFLINVPIGIVGLVVGLRLVRGVDTVLTRRPLDWAGLLAVASGIALAVLTLDSVRTEATHWFLVAAGMFTALAVLGWAARHLLRTPHPLVDLRILRVTTFRASATYGSIYRMLITAVPFLLPLMFQTRFGWTPLQSGLMVIALFGGNLAIKPATTTLMRRFGIRTVLIVDATASVACFALLALVDPATPVVVVAAILVVSGALRSVGFTAFGSVTFADIDTAHMTHANTLNATLQELFAGFGIALGALALTVSGSILTGLDRSAEESFSWSFAILGVLMLVTVVGAFRMPADAGRAITRAT